MIEEIHSELTEEVTGLINQALQRIDESPPEETVGMAVAFMVATDLIGVENAHKVSFGEFYELFALIFRNITA